MTGIPDFLRGHVPPARLRGVRGCQGPRSPGALHEIDARNRFTQYSLDLKWAIECKCWNTRVPKEKVLVLRELVEDVGADSGILLSRVGFQKGALDVASTTSIRLLTEAELREMVATDLLAAKGRAMIERARRLQ